MPGVRGPVRTEKPCRRAAESGGDMASTPHGEEKRTKEHASAAPCGSMRRLLPACAARKKLRNQAMRSEHAEACAKEELCGKKGAFRPHHGRNAASAASRMNKSGNPLRISALSYPHLPYADVIRLLVGLGCKDADAYNNNHKTGANGEYQSSEFHSILLEDMKECLNVVVLTVSYSDDCPHIRMKSSMFFLEHNRGVS